MTAAIPEPDVPDANPPAVSPSDRPAGGTHQVVDGDPLTDERVETACGRSVRSADHPVVSAWVATPHWRCCPDCATETGLAALTTDVVLAFLRAKLGGTYLIEVVALDDTLAELAGGLPPIDITPRDGTEALGDVDQYFRHLDYRLVGVETDHRDAPMARYSPPWSGTVTIRSAREQP